MKNYWIDEYNSASKQFVNRTEIRNIIMTECNHNMQKHNYFKVISIYGIGGIGKTKLLDKIKQSIFESEYKRKVISISFEIDKNHQSLENLIKIRKALKKRCCLFDFALLLYWDRNRCERLNSDFMNALKKNFITDFIDVLVDIADIPLSLSEISLPQISIPSINDIFDFINLIIVKFPDGHYKRIIKEISSSSDIEILDNMPLYLGIDIMQQMKDDIPTVFIFDSYQQSQPYSESQEWLLKLIGTIHKGLFIITSREELLWQDDENDIFVYKLNAFPEDAARELLECYIPKEKNDLIETIIESTECVPIYVDLAIKVYQKELTSHSDPHYIIDKSLFQDRNLLVKQFINHMPKHWQDLLIDLSVVKIFNEDIFDYIIKDQNLPCPLTDYYSIVNISLIDYQETSGELIKLHDVFCMNGSKILPVNVKLKIFRSYLTYLSYRLVRYDSYLSIKAMVTLFLNVLSIEKNLSKEIDLDVADWEKTLDMFFQLYDMKAQFIPPLPQEENSDNYNDILYLVSSINHKCISTHESVKLFESVKNPDIFGVHKKSYLLLWNYAVSLLGKYDDWYNLLSQIINNLDSNDQGRWYDTRTKLYLADYWIMTGSFKKAYQMLLTMKNYLLENYMSEEDALLVYRYIGHMFRFNFNCKAAAKSYLEIYKKFKDSISVDVYINTNLCETYCYFKPEFFDEKFEDILFKAQQLKHIKNIGKLYYSRAIARIIKKDFNGAQEDITKSIEINRNDGYQSGKLFAYMAQAYLEYSIYANIQPKTYQTIMDLIEQNNVYSYFQLPIFIMQGMEVKAEELRNNYEWLDFDSTVQAYNQFFKQLQS